MIDIKPGNPLNSINPGGHGVIPVAILTTASFDAMTVAPDTVRFAGAPPVKWSAKDVDDDRDVDLKLHFITDETDIYPGDKQACLHGETFNGERIEGCDAIRTVPLLENSSASLGYLALAPLALALPAALGRLWIRIRGRWIHP